MIQSETNKSPRSAPSAAPRQAPEPFPLAPQTPAAAERPPLPVRRPDLLLVPHGDGGEYVAKDPATGAYYHLGPQESYLLLSLDGRKRSAQICDGYQRRFGDSLSPADLDGFIELADSMQLLTRHAAPATTPERAAGRTVPAPLVPPPQPTSAASSAAANANRQSILYWRKSLFDPDRLFNRLEPKIRFVWTRAFFVLSAVAVLVALGLMLANRQELISRFSDVFSFKTLVLAWITLVTATTLHEFAHGLTCKHYGGEVHEVGFLLLFFMPAFFCNVSDAWLFREKSKRVWVTLAGGYCDLLLWAAAVFVWRLTMQDSLVNYLAWVVLSICGVRIFFNFNPLLKLDGYYLLSDIASVPNLRQRSWDYLMGHLRWVLWGADRPAAEQKGKFLFGFGAAVWVYSLSFLGLMFLWLTWWWGEKWGPMGTLAAVAVGATVTCGQFSGLSNGEVWKMLKGRQARVAGWSLALLGTGAVLTLVPLEMTASGTFQVRSTTHAEVRAPMAGFLREVAGDEGDRVAPGAMIARLEVPDLSSRVAQARAEIEESEAKLRLLKFGPRGAQGTPTATGASESVIRAAEVDAEKAHLDKLTEQLRFLQDRMNKLTICSPAGGVISTQRLREKVGQYFNDGDLICLVEEPRALEAQIDVPEEEAARIRPGQKVQLKARALPFDQLATTVDRVAPAAEIPNIKEGKLQSTVPVYCKLTGAPAALRPGMTGFARVSCGKRAMGRVLSEKALRYLRTEFWW